MKHFQCHRVQIITISLFLHHSPYRVRTLFQTKNTRTFQGPNFEISRTSFLFTSKNLLMEIVWQYNSCSFSVTKMRENNAKALVTILDPTARRVCMTWLEWLIIFTEVMRVRKNSRTFKGQEWRAEIFEDFKARPWKCTLKIQGFSRVFKTRTNPVPIFGNDFWKSHCFCMGEVGKSA